MKKHKFMKSSNPAGARQKISMMAGRGSSKKKGFSLVESLLVIGFMAGATAVAFVVYKSWMDNNNADQASQALTHISKGVHSISAVSLDYAALGTSPGSLLPETVFDRAANKPLDSPWGPVSITMSSGAKPHDSYTVLFEKATPNGCSKIILRSYQGYSQVSVNAAVLWKMADGKLDPAKAAAACAGSSNEVAFQSMTLLGTMPTATPIPTAPPIPTGTPTPTGPPTIPAPPPPVCSTECVGPYPVSVVVTSGQANSAGEIGYLAVCSGESSGRWFPGFAGAQAQTCTACTSRVTTCV